MYAIIDPGPLHSYINSSFMKSRNLKSKFSKAAMVVSSSLGQTVLVDQVCRWFPLETHNISFPVDFLIMPIGSFVVILGIDWLTEHCVVLDYRKENYSIQSQRGEIMEVNDIRSSDLSRIISSIQDYKLLNQECEAFLAYIYH